MVHVDDVRVNALTHDRIDETQLGYAKQPNEKANTITRSDGA